MNFVCIHNGYIRLADGYISKTDRILWFFRELPVLCISVNAIRNAAAAPSWYCLMAYTLVVERFRCKVVHDEFYRKQKHADKYQRTTSQSISISKPIWVIRDFTVKRITLQSPSNSGLCLDTEIPIQLHKCSSSLADPDGNFENGTNQLKSGLLPHCKHTFYCTIRR